MAVDVKICGLTRPADAALAASLGAARLGVVFASGPRVVSAAQARDIVAAAAGVPVLGVFAPGPLQSILDMIASAGLAGAQLHGDHDRTTAPALRAAGVEVWSVVAVSDDHDGLAELADADPVSDGVVIEARVSGGSGGKGIPVGIELARRAREHVRVARFVLSGGLTPDRLASAIAAVRPDVVDVSSGIESAPGIKDRMLMARFLEIARAAPART